MESTERSGIVFTFDDQYVNEWYSARDLFQEFGIKATFFINRPQELTPEEIAMLKQLQAGGHEIACHSMNHVNINDFLLTHTVKEYIDQEIIPAIAILNDLGFDIKSYAYPYGVSTPIVNEELLKYFRIIRKATYNIENLDLDKIDRVYTKMDSNQVIDAMGIDSGYGISLESLEKGMIRAKSENEYLALFAHRVVEDPTGSQISPEYLRKAFILSKKYELKSITISELVKPELRIRRLISRTGG